MSIKRQPLKNKKKPDYPPLNEAKIERRKFFLLVGGASTAALFYTACDDSSEDYENNWENDGTDGEGPDQESENFNIRIPEKGYRAVTLICGTEISYCIWLTYVGESMTVNQKEHMLVIADDVLDKYSIDAIQQEDAFYEIQVEIRNRFEQYAETISLWCYNLSLSLEIYEQPYEDGGVDSGPDSGSEDSVSR